MHKAVGRIAFLGLALGVGLTPAQARFELQTGGRTVLFGDVAFGPAFFIEWADQFVRARYPDSRAELISIGLWPSNAARGLDRLDCEVLAFAPDEVILCFGLDAADRKPFDQAKLASFLANYEKMIDRVQAAGASAVLMTPPPPEEARNRAFKRINYEAVVAKYAAGVRELAARKQVKLLDWHAAVGKYVAAHGSKQPTRHYTKNAVMPSGLGIALCIDLLLEHWGAEPLTYQIETDWTGSGATSVTTGTAELAHHDEKSITLRLTDVPTPMNMAARGDWPRGEWPLDRWCNYTLKVLNVPSGGILISTSDGKGTKPFMASQLRAGVNMARLGPLVDNDTVRTLHTAIRTKLNQLSKYRNSCGRTAPYPELEKGYQMYTDAERELAIGALRVALRLPARYDIGLNIKVASGRLPNQPARKKPARPTGRQR